jgi:hypothetical protein
MIYFLKLVCRHNISNKWRTFYSSLLSLPFLFITEIQTRELYTAKLTFLRERYCSWADHWFVVILICVEYHWVLQCRCVKMWKIYSSEHIKLDLVTEFSFYELQTNNGADTLSVPDRFWQSPWAFKPFMAIMFPVKLCNMSLKLLLWIKEERPSDNTSNILEVTILNLDQETDSFEHFVGFFSHSRWMPG